MASDTSQKGSVTSSRRLLLDSQEDITVPAERAVDSPKSGQITVTHIACRSSTQQHQQSRRDRTLRKMLLLNGYPIAYIILWIPGIANRLTETIAGESPQWLTGLQATTQLVGFANAVTYAWTEQLRGKVMGRYRFVRRGNREVYVLPERRRDWGV